MATKDKMVQRIRDPLHDLIEFADDIELEHNLWKVIQTRPFQRLRRIKQLGFSDFVYPGATHSRFAHSVGVFHTARELMQIVNSYQGNRHESKARRALAAALVHDLGHGPFSHAFEEVGKRLGLELTNHEIVGERLIRDGEVSEILNEIGRGYADDVADIVAGVGNKTVHYAVVSSQFDADRLDYMRRDRLMTGTQHSAIDFTWLLANLEIAEVPIGVDDSQVGLVETFVLGPKAVHAAEAYVLGLFQLYPTVYFHKANRGAEKLFTELLVKVVELVRNGSTDATGLPRNHPLVRFALDPENITTVLALDDTVIFGALPLMIDASDSLIADFAKRLRDRKLYKCLDIRIAVTNKLDPKSVNSVDLIKEIDRKCAAIEIKVTEWANDNNRDRPRILIDKERRSPYKAIAETEGPLDRINVRTDGDTLVDLKERSSVVAALKTFKLFRAYVEEGDSVAREAIQKIVTGEVDQ